MVGFSSWNDKERYVLKDLRSELTPLWAGVQHVPARPGMARTIMFVSIDGGQETSAFPANFALMASRRSKRPVWLVDLDFQDNRQFSAFDRGLHQGIGRPGRAYDASLQSKPIFTIHPSQTPAEDAKRLTAHEIDGTNAIVTRFRSDHMQKGQRVEITGSPAWWKTLRQASDWIIVDAPALTRSGVALKLLSDMDAVILIVQADQHTASDIRKARHRLEAQGGNVLGIVMHDVSREARRWA